MNEEHGPQGDHEDDGLSFGDVKGTEVPGPHGGQGKSFGIGAEPHAQEVLDDEGNADARDEKGKCPPFTQRVVEHARDKDPQQSHQDRREGGCRGQRKAAVYQDKGGVGAHGEEFTVGEVHESGDAVGKGKPHSSDGDYACCGQSEDQRL